MPLRPLSRDQAWILPPNLDELVRRDHTARFVAEFIDAPGAARAYGADRGRDGHRAAGWS